jgi:LEA14-like dessication related protein
MLLGCMEYKDVEMVKVVDFGVKDITSDGVVFQVSMQIKNPNNYKINIVDSDLDLYVKDNKTGKVILKDKVTLPENSNKIHHFVFKSDYKNLTTDPASIIGMVIGGNQLEVEVKGDIKAKAKGLSKKFPVEFKEKISL